MIKVWDDLPKWMKTPEVREYYEILLKRKWSLLLKRGFDVILSAVMLIVLSPVMIIIAIRIAVDSPGGVFYRQVRVTSYGHKFRIHKFRTMVVDADAIGPQVTVGRDDRVTKVGLFLRKYRLDELPQLIDVLKGDMSFVGTRPEVPRYVKKYTPEMRATLLLPAGITSEASIQYKDESDLLEGVEDVDRIYVEKILPEKMKYNLKSLKQFSFWREIITILRTVFLVFGRKL